MHVATTPAALYRALRILKGVVPARTTLPVISHVLAVAEAGRFFLTGTDLDHRLSVEVEGVEVLGEGAMTVPFRPLGRITSRLASDDRLDLWAGRATRSSEPGLTLESRQFQVTLDGLDATEFPFAPTLDPEEAVRVFTMPEHALAGVLGFVAPHASTEEGRPTLNGICLRWAKGGMLACGTNGHQLLELSFADPDASAEVWPRDGEVILSPRTLSLLNHLTGEDVEVTIWKNWIRLRRGETTMLGHLIEGPYPNWRQVITAVGQAKTVVQVRRADLAQVAERMLSVLGDEHPTKRLSLRFIPAECAVEIGCSPYDLGAARQWLPLVGCTGEEVRIGLNAQKLLAILGSLTSEVVRLRIAAPERAVLFDGSNDPGALALLMPLRLFDQPSDDDTWCPPLRMRPREAARA